MEIELTKSSSKGQVVIPKEIRDKIGVQKGTPFAVSLISGIVFLKKLDIETEFERLHKWGTRLARIRKWEQSEINNTIHKIRKSRKNAKSSA